MDTEPIAGIWYTRTDTDDLFLVNAVDDSDGLIEIQHYDGDLEEIEFSEWEGLEVEISPPPVDWAGPMDDAPFEDRDSETRPADPGRGDRLDGED